MPVPKTTVHEDNLLAPRKDQVRFAGKVFGVQAVAVAEGENQLAHGKFRRGVFAPDLAHDFAAFFFSDRVQKIIG